MTYARGTSAFVPSGQCAALPFVGSLVIGDDVQSSCIYHIIACSISGRPNPGDRMMQRYIRKDRRIYAHSTCRLCGNAYGVVPPEIEHRAAECLACGSRQCMGNGLARGTCGICYVGLLPGWSSNDRTCDYKGCTHAAIARVDGANKYRCREHLERGKWFGYVARQLLRRDVAWQLVDESPASPYALQVAVV